MLLLIILLRSQVLLSLSQILVRRVDNLLIEFWLSLLLRLLFLRRNPLLLINWLSKTLLHLGILLSI